VIDFKQATRRENRQFHTSMKKLCDFECYVCIITKLLNNDRLKKFVVKLVSTYLLDFVSVNVCGSFICCQVVGVNKKSHVPTY
jgi:uncharacterized membrane protein